MTDKAALRVVFRVDASLDIGTGHVIRCLTLADRLRGQGAEVGFVCREFEGHLCGLIEGRGFNVSRLPLPAPGWRPPSDGEPRHASWLGLSWQEDAEQTAEAIAYPRLPDWLVVDHYALDSRWEQTFRARGIKLLAIDDLADRSHDCDVLLDQNLGRVAADYESLVPIQARIFVGPENALLRPEFSNRRSDSLARRRSLSSLRNILISMGGVDQPNATARVLEALRSADLPEHCRLTVVMGPHAPWLADVRVIAAGMRWPTEVVVNVSNMADLMAESDLAIGAAGTTSWERCCLGLPTLVVVLADNQRYIAQSLERSGIAISLDAFPSANFDRELREVVWQLVRQPDKLRALSEASSIVTNGHGADRITLYMMRADGT